MKLLTMALCAILIGGCASVPLTDEQLYERENRETLRLEQFYRDERACRRAGGFIVIKRWSNARRKSSGRKLAPPGRGDTYGCATRMGY